MKIRDFILCSRLQSARLRSSTSSTRAARLFRSARLRPRVLEQLESSGRPVSRLPLRVPEFPHGHTSNPRLQLLVTVRRSSSAAGQSPSAARQLSSAARRPILRFRVAGALKVPFVFLTNGGGVRESIRAAELSELFGICISPLQVLQGHAPFKQLVHRFEHKFVVAVGKGEPAAVMSDYGFKNVISIDDYASCFDGIDPLASHKKWATDSSSVPSRGLQDSSRRDYVSSERVQAAFIVSDSVDWSRDIQVLCDIMKTGGLPGTEIVLGHQPALYFAHDDLAYQATFPTERLGMGAFRIALQAVFNSIHPHHLQYTDVGKPNPLAFKNAEAVLRLLHREGTSSQDLAGNSHFRTLYMIGDNPKVDIKGARQAGSPWTSILTRTGVFKGKGNDFENPADMVVDTVGEAVDYILKRERLS